MLAGLFAIAARLFGPRSGGVGSKVQSRPHAGSETKIAAALKPMTLADQWARVSSIISTASEKAAEAGRCQTAAAMQLDLAHYGLTSLIAELSTVMDIGARPASASVHVLKLGKSHKVEGALAA